MTHDRVERFDFWHEGTRLAGTLRIPDGHGPFPAIVTLQGSGDADRDNNGYFVPIRDCFLQARFAVLGYDKPGVGGSTGNWRDRNLLDRAAEALCAVQALRDHPEVDARRVGLFGHSQGGWVAPIVASWSSSVAFVIAQSGPGIRPPEQNLHDIEHSMRRDGFDADSISQGVAFVRALIDAARQGVEFEQLDEILHGARDRPWWRYISAPDAATWRFFTNSWHNDPDPAVVLRQVRGPVLAIFGERDHLLPVAESVEVYRRSLAAAGNPDVTIRVFRGADHRIQIDGGEFTSGYFTLLTEWLRERANR